MKLGLIGTNIQKTRSNELHEFLGREYGSPVTYELFDKEFDSAEALVRFMESLGQDDYRGINVTQPYKLWAWDMVTHRELQATTLGALNTVLLSADRGSFRGTNTDCTGFTHAFRDHFGQASPGKVLIKGTGGVGRAIAFGLVQLGVERIDLMDTNPSNCEGLDRDLKQAGVQSRIVSTELAHEAIAEATGIVNATPIGHYATPGNAFDGVTLKGQTWAFDAVYTPVMTPFMTMAEKAGLDILTGFELFLYQGIDAFEFFTGITVNPDVARRGVKL